MERNTRIEDELFPFYALDALTDEERAEVEAYVAGNPAAAARLLAAQDAVAMVTAELEPVAPDAAVKARLMARIADETAPLATPSPTGRRSAAPSPQPSPTGRGSAARGPSLRDFFFGRALGFAVLLLLLGGFGLFRLWQQTNDLRAQVATLEAQAVALQSDVDRLQTTNDTLWAELAARDETLAHLRQPGAVTVTIGDATGEHPAAVGMLTMMPGGDEAMLTIEGFGQKSLIDLKKKLRALGYEVAGKE